MTFYATLSTDELIDLMDDANVVCDDAQYDACYAELERRNAVPLELRDDYETSGWYEDDADLESYSLECAFGPEE